MNTNTITPPDARAGRREWIGLAVLALPTLLLSLDMGVLFLALPRLSVDLGASSTQLLWITDIYGFKELAKDGWQSLPILAMLVGVAFGVMFVRRQGLLRNPLLDLRLFKNRTFRTALLLGLIGGATMGGTFLFVSQYLQLVEGLSPLRAGLWMVPSTLAMIAASMLAPVIAQRIRPGMVIAAGLAISAIGFGVLTQVGSGGGLAVLVTGFVIAAVGIAPPAALGTGLVVGAAPPEKAGSASAMSETSGEFGIALGLATLGSAGAAVYRSQMTVPAEIPTDVAGVARESAAGAVSAGQDLPGPLGAELLVAAREAFTSGLNTVATVSAVSMAAFAILAIVLLRHVRPAAESTAEAETTEEIEVTPVAIETVPIAEPLEPVGALSR